jgi:hypothetical protein
MEGKRRPARLPFMSDPPVIDHARFRRGRFDTSSG